MRSLRVGQRRWTPVWSSVWSSLGSGRSFLSQPRLAARDAYAVLGLDRSATNAEIKARFRELAKQYHPDLNKGDRGASVKMAELTSAYDTLTDAKKRAALDHAAAGAATASPSSASAYGYTGFGSDHRFDQEWVNPSQMFSEFNDVFGRSTQRGQQGASMTSQRGEDISVNLDVSFLEAMQGCQKVVSLMSKQTCPECRGSGAKEGTTWTTCPLCKGKGVHRVERGILSMGVPCHRCSGTGQVLEHPCRMCKGEGVRTQPRGVRVHVPAGVRHLMELRVPGAGHAGLRGGKSGHLFVTVKVLPHAQFRHIDDDVHLDVPLTLRQALLGGEVQIPTLTGSAPESLIVQAPTQPGSTKVLRSRGPPKLSGDGRGNLVLHFMLQLPKTLTSRQVALIEEFDALVAGAEAATGREHAEHREKRAKGQSAARRAAYAPSP
mmetsp:Transcript_52409/g.125196  ORF Transcript_52409/g.125196 Transcript_52409/m.125196 type:complete len:435 (+) Transcript_52409:120-1424(+)